MPLYRKPAAGGTGSVATDTIWNTKGDLAAASADNAASVLPIGANNQVLVADSAQTLGMKWAANPTNRVAGSNTAVTFSNDTNEHVYIAAQIPAGQAQTNDWYYLHAMGTMLNNPGGASNWTFGMRQGTNGTTADLTVAAFSDVVSFGASANTISWALVIKVCVVTGNSATGSWAYGFEWLNGRAANPLGVPIANANTHLVGYVPATTTDTTVAQYIDFTVQMGTANVNCVFTMKNYEMFRVPA